MQVSTSEVDITQLFILICQSWILMTLTNPDSQFPQFLFRLMLLEVASRNRLCFGKLTLSQFPGYDIT